MKKVICISGKARSGKDTIAKMMSDELISKGKRVLITHYADLLKYICETLFNWDGSKDDYGRSLLQYVGTEVVRQKDEDFWVNYVVKILNFFGDEWDYAIIPDCRFPNEIDILKQWFDVESIRITRPGFKNDLSRDQSKHLSENALDDYKFDVYVYNTKDLNYLNEGAKRYIQYLIDES